MDKFRDDSGAALISTLMIITLLLIFILTLFMQITNTSKQVSRMEKDLVAEQIAQMGVDYFRAYIGSVIPDKIDSVEQLKDLGIQSKNPIMLDKNHKFWIENEDLNVPSESTEEIIIEFTSIGEAYGKQKSINSSITIYVEGGD